MRRKQLPRSFYEHLSDGADYDFLTSPNREYDVSTYKIRSEVEKLDENGFDVEVKEVNSRGKKEFVLHSDVEEVMDGDEEVNYSETSLLSSKAKQTITREANEYLKKLERETKKYLDQVGSLQPTHGEVRTDKGEDVVLHCSDDHFGDIVKTLDGEVIYNSDIAAERVRERFDKAISAVKKREEMGHTVDNIHVLLGGDHVTNEAIYDEQPHDIDATIDEQINRATAVYIEQLMELSKKFPFVKVVCQAGNHGEMRVRGSSGKANADRFFFDRLEMLAKAKGLDNMKFVKSDRKDHVNFEMRGHKGHLRHGQHVSNHIGTSSPQSDWRSFLLENRFDIAYRGHYHTHKIEHINGTPVVMAPSVKPAGEYEGTLAIFDEAMSYVHGVTDDNPLAWTEYITYED